MFPAVSNLEAPEVWQPHFESASAKERTGGPHNSLKITQHEWVNSDPENLSPEPSPQPQHCVASHLPGHAEKVCSRPGCSGAHKREDCRTLTG